MSFYDYERQHLENTKYYIRQTDRIFSTGIGRIANIYKAYPINPDVPFDLNQYPQLKQSVNSELQRMAKQINGVCVNGIQNEWVLCNNKLDQQVGLLLGDKALPTALQQSYFQRNIAGLAAFTNRTDGGFKLSDRVWNIVKGYAIDVEKAMGVGIHQGSSAAELATDMKRYLKEPARLFRRVSDAGGNLRLSKAAREYHPGRGVYRSSYKNALRLTRTETNKAYKTAEHLRYQQLDFVLGYEIRRSNAMYDCDVCQSLQGRYPKTYMWDGWHPHCMCHMISIVPSQEEFWKSVDANIAGKDYNFSGMITKPELKIRLPLPT